MKDEEFLLSVVLFRGDHTEILESKHKITIIENSSSEAVELAVALIPQFISYHIPFAYGCAWLKAYNGIVIWNWVIDIHGKILDDNNTFDDWG